MVRAILEGRKTQTRRVLKGVPMRLWAASGWEIEDGDCMWCDAYGDYHSLTSICPYGRIGDRLWVRETWAPVPILQHTDGIIIYSDSEATYKASPSVYSGIIERWRPSIFMPRWAARITLEVESVRVERLQDISEEDAKVEGIPNECGNIAIDTYAGLWNKINGPGSWDANPWVWAVTFKRITP